MNFSWDSEFADNKSNNGSSPEEFLPGEVENLIYDNGYVRIIFIGLYSVVFFFCVFGNLAVVLVVTLHWKMRSITKFCLGNLAFANFCVGVFCVYQNLSTFLIDRWVFGSFLCKMYHFINSLSHTASILILIVICMERYLAVIHSFKSRQWITITRLKVAIVTVWIISAIICSPRLYYINIIYFPVTSASGKILRYDMICAPQHSLYNAPTVDMIYFILLFVLPLLIISILYTRICIYVWKSSHLFGNKIKIMKDNKRSGKSRSSRKNSRALSSLKTTQEVSRFSRLIQIKRFYSSEHSSFIPSRPATTTFPENIEEIEERRISSGNEILELDSNLSNAEFEVLRGNLSRKKFSLICVEKIETLEIAQNYCNYCLSDEDFQEALICGNYNNGINLSEASPYCLNCSQSFGIKGANQVSNSTRILHKKLCKRRVANLRGNGNGGVLREKWLRPRQVVVRMMIVVVMSFALCNLPFHIRKLCLSYLPNYEIDSTFNNVLAPLTFLLMYGNCALNPIIYAFMSKDFRCSLIDMVKCRLKRNYLKYPDSNTAILNVGLSVV